VNAQGKREKRVIWHALHRKKHSQVMYGVNLQKVQQERGMNKGR